jgi:hypothetical protein
VSIESESILREITAISHYFNYHKNEEEEWRGDKNVLARKIVCAICENFLGSVTKMRKISFANLGVGVDHLQFSLLQFAKKEETEGKKKRFSHARLEMFDMQKT